MNTILRVRVRRLAVHAIAKVVSAVQEVVHLQNEDLPHLIRSFEQTKHGFPNPLNRPSSPAIEACPRQVLRSWMEGPPQKQGPTVSAFAIRILYLYFI